MAVIQYKALAKYSPGRNKQVPTVAGIKLWSYIIAAGWKHLNTIINGATVSLYLS
jgi:hypothetical protein